MASSAHSVLPHFSILAILLALLATLYTATGCYTGIFAFGDSYMDPGNYIALNYSYSVQLSRLPFGMTYFHHATGRFTDGRTMPDLYAQALGLPLQQPYLAIPSGYDVRQGVNFAVGGATALDLSFFVDRGIRNIETTYMLREQMGWFKQLLPSLCSSESDCKDVLGRALFLLGEIGMNDFNYPLIEGRNLTELWTFVPHILDAVISTANELIKLGARTLLVPGMFPNGCVPMQLIDYKRQVIKEEDYDPVTGCLLHINKMTVYYNLQLQDALEHLRQQNPHTTIIYADYYKAAMMIFESPETFGFNKTTALCVCCGGGSLDNYHGTVGCNFPGSKVCDDLSAAVFLTRFHFTEAAYKVMARTILEGPYADPPLAHTCPQIIQSNKDLNRYVY